MPQEIYNEGRVVGLSAWEIFYREALSNGVDPQDIPNERQWLASMIGMGASMVYNLPGGVGPGVYEIPLPSDSSLTAAGVIIASPFLGDCEYDLSGWANKVTSYSPMILNNSEHSPVNGGGYGSVPYDENYTDEIYSYRLSDFLKITDGIVFTENAKWIETNGVPEKDIDPNFNESTTFIRLYINSQTQNEVPIIFTGFQNKRILQSLSGWASDSGIGGSTDTDRNDWLNGGMLGPEIIPWANKIIFTIPSASYSLMNRLTRTLPTDDLYNDKTVGGITFKNRRYTVKTNSLIDLDSINLPDYYTVHSSELSGSNIVEDVTQVSFGVNDSYNSLIAWYPGMTAYDVKIATDSSMIFPPALYATQVTELGSHQLIPLDTAAPGTVKGFKNSTQAYNYTQKMPDNFAMYYNTTSKMFTFVVPGQSDSTKWPGLAKMTYITSRGYPEIELEVGNVKGRAIALTNSSGNTLPTVGTSGTIQIGPSSDLTWDRLLNALQSNKSLDLLGTKLKNLGQELTTNNTIGVTNAVTTVKATNIQGTTITATDSISGNSITSSTTVNAQSVTAIGDVNTPTLDLYSGSIHFPLTSHSRSDLVNYLTIPSGSSIELGTNFIKFANGLKLYILTSDSTPPTAGVPTGSIGIGW